MVQPDASVMAMANPEIGRSLGASTADLPWVTGSRQPALAASLIPGGRLGDRFGRRTYHLVGVAGFTLASVAIGPAGSVEGVTDREGPGVRPGRTPGPRPVRDRRRRGRGVPDGSPPGTRALPQNAP